MTRHILGSEGSATPASMPQNGVRTPQILNAPPYLWSPRLRVAGVGPPGRHERGEEASSDNSAKGEEADYVVVVDLKDDHMGFPSLVEDDPVLGMFQVLGRTVVRLHEEHCRPICRPLPQIAVDPRRWRGSHSLRGKKGEVPRLER